MRDGKIGRPADPRGTSRATDRRRVLIGLLAAAAVPTPAWASEGEADTPRAEWYSEASWARWGAWGPPARVLPAPSGLSDRPDEVARRVVAAAEGMTGLGYQHHHLPDFDPPEGWPWRPVRAGRNGPGLDCSNFTSLAFNRALGIKLPTEIRAQASATAVGGPGGRGVATLSRVTPTSYSEAVALLRPADLLFVRSDAGRLSHVVLWLGAVGGVPSFIDCTDSTRRGPGGEAVPPGVGIRAFLPDGWYGRRFAHALRLDGLGTGSGRAPAVAEGGDL